MMIRGTFMKWYREHMMEIRRKKREEYDGKFLLVTQKEWENDVIWDVDSFKEHQESCEKQISRSTWIPNLYSRHQPMFPFSLPQTIDSCDDSFRKFKIMNDPVAPIIATEKGEVPENPSVDEQNKNAFGISILPIENPDLANYRWEDDIILDADEEEPEMWKELLPCYDLTDDNIVLNIPPDSGDRKTLHKIKKQKGNAHTSKKFDANGNRIRDPPNHTNETGEKSDPYNISNDQYYRLGKAQMSLSMFSNRQKIVHPKPVQDFHPLLFPTSQFHHHALRGYHRPSIRGLLTPKKLYSIQKVHKRFSIKMEKKNQERRLKAQNKQMGEQVPEVFSSFDSLLELTGRYGDILLAEYCEQFPPLLCQVGMHSKITNYVRKRRNTIGLDLKYGECDTARENTFLGELKNDSVLQTLENNLYRCPMYEHPVNFDFLLIRVGDSLFVREIDAKFTCGQQSPMIVVPQPKSKAALTFTKDFLKVEICRNLSKSRSIPKTIEMGTIKQAFPNLSENSIRKVLSCVSDYQRGGGAVGVWKMKGPSEFTLPSDSDMGKIITPEQYCTNYSSESAELRLKMLGYAEKHFLSAMSRSKVGEKSSEPNEDFDLQKMEEVSCAPWNTTRAFLSAIKGNCLLDVNGPADPTGCGEGFSYTRTAFKPFPTQDSNQKKNLVDLRKLGVLEAKKVLKTLGVPESQSKKLSRWEIIDLIKTISSEKDIENEKGQAYSRVNPQSVAQRQKRNKEERQRIFDLQNRLLSSSEVLSSDEDYDSDASDIEEAGKQLEEMLVKNVSQAQMDLEAEERERSNLIKMLMEEKEEEKPEENSDGKKRRVLKIHRKYLTPDGDYTITETVDNQDVIDIYEKIQKTGLNAEDFLKSGVLKKGAERLKANTKRLELDKKRRQKEREEKEAKRRGDGLYHPNKKEPTRGRLKPGFGKKCSACGAIGHLKTNSCCPKYVAPKRTKWEGVRTDSGQPLVIKIKKMKIDTKDDPDYCI